jgi:predicted TIM-barrel fold metal-dependent hydrolase
VLVKYPQLRLCFGHAGGGHFEYKDTYESGENVDTDGWFTAVPDWDGIPNNYPRKVVALCCRYENVYADFSYLQEIIDNRDKMGCLIENLKRQIARPGNFPLSDKLIYGSDWHMARMLDRTNVFLDAFEIVWGAGAFAPVMKDKFLFQNAIRFLDLQGFIDRQLPPDISAVFDDQALAYLQDVVNGLEEVP